MTPRVALVHERFTDVAGSEHVVEQMALAWPEARIHVPFARPSGIPRGLGSRVVTGPLQRAYQMIGCRSHAPLLPLVPSMLRHARIDPAEADVVVISHHAFALAAAAVEVPSVAYVHSPARWAWDAGFRRGEAGSVLGRSALSVLAARARANERRWAPVPEVVVANSAAVRDRIRAWWGRDAEVVHPPVDTGFFTPGSGAKEDYFVSVGRLVPYKRVDLAVAAAVEAGVRLLVVGEGRDMDRCRARSGPGVEFLGRLPREEMREVIRGARALLMPGEEDFGIVPVEAIAAGTPVLALGRGGALDTVVPGVSGELVNGRDDDEVVHALARAMRSWDDASYSASGLARFAARFSEASFRSGISAVVDSVL
ncbi:glycosyltransferase [Dietzia sp. 179-F 9C3 NHS]|uniref:glycosyltransferase n=1 Tax=Dietzia sp. 179-F 9C3 NHS TaxID=3374295 RepID=UPI00387900EC